MLCGWCDVRLSADSDRIADVLACPKSAGSRHHSITSSAAACSVRGTVRPYARAVLRLITRPPGLRTGIVAVQTGMLEGLADACFGSEADIRSMNGDVRYAHESGHPVSDFRCTLSANSCRQPSLSRSPRRLERAASAELQTRAPSRSRGL